MVKKINHIAVIVDDIEKALVPYQKGLGLTPSNIEYVESYNVKVVFVPIGDTQIELVQPLGDEGELVEFLRATGGGLHHIAIEVEDINRAIHHAASSGILLKDMTPRPGAHNSSVAFAERESFDGVVIEFVQPPK
ncbi:VOC family protein [Thermoflavimicrobium dichotomicum]|uniref:Lactoylglutathione lyase/methylmalonyl-CoA mutase, C-terminal domain/methylmalonyl-CoA/ethylmalonyl-CoA epimerase n=1 Tax=Thermoflavimicrobium dichotomicum TaxID=46223 RepID=A0A1I3TAN7_9BACL|nr:VOC family protein [Thermoflavimicrobium dichotomicum]SFJ66726.1 lactoylglutathione lyase/methylmalonyl-CoA mutase, C-terminal domain/methylmalonyl-CoA/ethylmalonyl-CoA epimerase [Thermoflavimicrobium dichotomicum]